MKLYVEACREDGSEKLGNCDGQHVFRGKDIRRTNLYKAMKMGQFKYCNNDIVAYWSVQTEDGKELERIINPNYTGKGYKAFKNWKDRVEGENNQT